MSSADKRVEGCLYLTLLVLPLCLFHSSLQEGLSIDIPLFLQQAILYTPWQYFFDPYAYQHISSFNLTPLLTLSYHLDYLIDGINPFIFHLHNLLSAGILLALCYYFLRTINTPRLAAYLVSLCFTLMPSFALVTMALNTRHYIEGLIFTLGSLILFRQDKVQQNYLLLGLSALCYLLAISAKEVFTPLPLLLLIIAQGSLLNKVRAIGFHALIAAVYILWRFFMLNGMPEVYANKSELSSQVAFNSSIIYFISAFGNKYTSASFASLVMLGLWSMLVNKRFHILLVMATFAAACLPMLSLIHAVAARGVNGRWHFLFNWVVLVFIAWGISSCRQVYLKWAMQLILSLLIISQSQVILSKIKARAEVQHWLAARNHFILAGHQDRYLILEESVKEFMMTDYLSQVAYLKQLNDGKHPTLALIDPTLLNWIGNKSSHSPELPQRAFKQNMHEFIEVEHEIPTPHYMPTELENEILAAIQLKETGLNWDFRHLQNGQCQSLQLTLIEDYLVLNHIFSLYKSNYNLDWYTRHTGTNPVTSTAIIRCKTNDKWLYTHTFTLSELQADKQ